LSTSTDRPPGSDSTGRPSLGSPGSPPVVADGNGGVSVTVPLTITVQVGTTTTVPGAPLAGPPATTPAEQPVEEAVSIDPDYTNRAGYDVDFLGTPVLLPALSAAQRAAAAVNRMAAPTADPTVLTYHHFSVVMNRRRRLAYYTAVNIDGSISRGLDRDHDKWFFDPRIERDDQVGEPLYTNNDFDRGHLVRRLDPAWGQDEQTARVANDDTFHFTNCSPQHKRFNQSEALWAGLENFILNDARASRRRVTVFNGPVMAADDPVYRQTQIPLAFWKVLVFAKPDGPLSATAYLISQKQLVDDVIAREAFVPETFQVPVSTVIELTGLDFSELLAFDPLNVELAESLTARETLGIRTPARHVATYGDLRL
jgi:endonuclease G